jgi:hypothetical protein
VDIVILAATAHTPPAAPQGAPQKENVP